MRHVNKLTIPLFCLAVLTAGIGCLRAGIGDPAQAQVDLRLQGVWQNEGDRDMLLVKAWDAHTYAVTELTSDVQPPASAGPHKVTIGRCYRAWLAKVDGQTFITLETTPQDLKAVERPFFVARIEIGSDRVVVRSLNPDFVHSAQTAAELENLVRENLDNPDLFLADDAIYNRVDPAGLVE